MAISPSNCYSTRNFPVQQYISNERTLDRKPDLQQRYQEDLELDKEPTSFLDIINYGKYFSFYLPQTRQ